jgi:hypothetical protein
MNFGKKPQKKKKSSLGGFGGGGGGGFHKTGAIEVKLNLKLGYVSPRGLNRPSAGNCIYGNFDDLPEIH